LGRTPVGLQESPAGRRKVPPVSGRAQKPSRGRGRDAGGSGECVSRDLGVRPPAAAGSAGGWRGAELSAAARPPLGFSRYPLSWGALVPIHALGALSGALSALASLPRQLSLSAADTPGCYAASATTLDTGYGLVLGYFPRQLALSVNAPASHYHILLVYIPVSDSVCRSDFLSGFWSTSICTILASVSLSFCLPQSFLSCHCVADVQFLSFVARAALPSFCVYAPCTFLFLCSQSADLYMLSGWELPDVQFSLFCAFGKEGVKQLSCIWAALERNERFRNRNGGCRSSLPTGGPRAPLFGNPVRRGFWYDQQKP